MFKDVAHPTATKFNMKKIACPLHPSQKDIYLDQLINTKSPHYNIGGYVKLKGTLNKEKFHEAVNSASKVFDAFQMRFDLNGTDPVCYFQEDYEKLEMTEISFIETGNPEEEAKSWMKNQFNCAFVINKETILFEHYLLKIADNENWFFGRYHHLITDGYGFISWVQYVGQKYKSLLVNDNLQLVYASYRDEAIKASAYMNSPRYELDGEYWKDKIIEKPKKFMYGKYQLQNNSDKKSASYVFILNEDQRRHFEEIQIKTKCSLQQLTIAALLIYFGKTTDQSEFVFGIPIHKRGSKRLRNIVGLFSGVLPYKGSYQNGIKLIDLLTEIAHSQKKDYRHQNYLIGDLSKALKIDPSEGYLCDIIINHELLNFQLDFGEEIQATVSELTNDFQRYPLQLCWQDFGQQQPLELHLNFLHQYFSQAEIELLSQRILFILEQFSTGLEKPVADINIIPARERFQLEGGFNNTKEKFPEDKTIVDLFNEQVQKTPNGIAVVFENKKLTYAQLNERSNQLAHYLRNKGVKEEVLVPVCIERSLEMVIGILGIIKAGGAYVPIDPEYPQDRINYMLEDTGAAIVLSTKKNRSKLQTAAGTEVIELDGDLSTIIGQQPTTNNQQPTFNSRTPSPGLRYLYFWIYRET